MNYKVTKVNHMCDGITDLIEVIFENDDLSFHFEYNIVQKTLAFVGPEDKSIFENSFEMSQFLIAMETANIMFRELENDISKYECYIDEVIWSDES